MHFNGGRVSDQQLLDSWCLGFNGFLPSNNIGSFGVQETSRDMLYDYRGKNDIF